MKLYLSSVGVPNKESLLGLVSPKKLSVAIIPNAWDVYPELRRDEEYANCRKLFKDMGFTPKRVDLKVLQGEELKSELLKHGLVWVMGGNTFYLNELVHKSSFYDIVGGLLNSGMVYGGESAGAVLAGTTLHGVEELDDPTKASKTLWMGLALIDFGIIPHWGMEKYIEPLEKCKEEMEKYSRVKTLTNEQAFVVDGGKFKLVEA